MSDRYSVIEINRWDGQRDWLVIDGSTDVPICSCWSTEDVKFVANALNAQDKKGCNGESKQV